MRDDVEAQGLPKPYTSRVMRDDDDDDAAAAAAAVAAASAMAAMAAPIHPQARNSRLKQTSFW